MKKIILGIFIFAFSVTALNAQVALAKLKFEDAEQAYNSGNYSTALNKLNDAEKLFGKINPPILHLKILVQDKLLQANKEDYTTLLYLKKNCQQYLKDYAELDGNEEKYKEVYKVSERYLQLPGNQEELNAYLQKKSIEKETKRKLIKKVLKDYLEAIGGEDILRKVKTISYTMQYSSSSPKSKLANSYDVEVKIITGEKIYMEWKLNKVTNVFYLSKNDGFKKSGKYTKDNFGEDYIETNQSYLYPITELIMIDKIIDSLDINESKLNEEECYLINYKEGYKARTIYYSKVSKLVLLIKEIESISLPVVREINSLQEIISYITVDGIKFPEKIKITIDNITNNIDILKYKLNPEFKPKDFEN